MDVGVDGQVRLDRQRVRALRSWFARHARDLPWRRRRTGYTALVAEAMLQQTQVARVLERFEAFIGRFPTVRALAAAREQTVLAMWQGMGYYRRARHLHAAARAIVRDHGGRVPRRSEVLRTLPGVGRYTAAAIASIVYGERVGLVDGNVQRVLARWDARPGSASDPRTVRWAWARAETLVEHVDDVGVLNEGLMELGALVCTPRAPRCDGCPVAKWCVARRHGLQGDIPAPKHAVRRRRVHHHAVVVTRGGKLLLEQRPAGGMWSSMWQVPTVESSRRLAPREVQASLATPVGELVPRGSFEHVTTHRLVEFHVYTAAGRGRGGVWRAPIDLGDLPMSNAQRRVLALGAAASGQAAASGHSQPKVPPVSRA